MQKIRKEEKRRNNSSEKGYLEHGNSILMIRSTVNRKENKQKEEKLELSEETIIMKCNIV